MTAARRSMSRVVQIGPSPLRWLTHLALALALIVTIARFITPDALRDPWETAPGGEIVSVAPGASTALVFDLVAALPALLVLVRRAVDREFRLFLHPGHVVLLALAGWMMLSTSWAADRFAAAVTSAHFAAAACLLWAMSQLVRDSAKSRLVAALCFGLMLVLVAQSVLYKFVDVPQNIAYWNEHKPEILRSHNWEPDSFSARQFEQKLKRGELVGFFNSANTLGAVGVLLFFACIGIGIQKLADGEVPQWSAVIVVTVVALVWIGWCAQSKTVAATPTLGAIVLCGWFVFAPQLRARHRLVFFTGLFVVAVALVAVVGHGLYHKGLFPGHFSNSLDFRWKYWTAAAAIFKDHPIIGVGWFNFGPSYLAHRLPQAAEEIKDPHSFIVRFFVELGLIGGTLALLWLVRMAWELTVPREPSQVNSTAADQKKQSDSALSKLTLRFVIPVLLLGMLLSIIATVDINISALDIVLLLMRPVLYALVLLVGTIAVCLRSSTTLDDRPAPWIYYCTLTGIGLFLLHNLIDFSWFEPGAMFIFMVLIGSALGMSNAKPIGSLSRAMAIGLACLLALCWLTAAVGFVGPVIAAEQLAQSANESIRTANPRQPDDLASHFHAAADNLQSAAQLVPYNSDYLYRAAVARINLHQLEPAKKLVAQCKQVNPLSGDAYLLDANIQLSSRSPEQSAVMADFQTLLKLNPNDVSLHVQFGRALDRFGRKTEAAEQYDAAIAADAGLAPGEPKRMTRAQIDQLKAAASVDRAR